MSGLTSLGWGGLAKSFKQKLCNVVCVCGGVGGGGFFLSYSIGLTWSSRERVGMDFISSSKLSSSSLVVRMSGCLQIVTNC